jgi:hypothetical protein
MAIGVRMSVRRYWLEHQDVRVIRLRKRGHRPHKSPNHNRLQLLAVSMRLADHNFSHKQTTEAKCFAIIIFFTIFEYLPITRQLNAPAVASFNRSLSGENDSSPALFQPRGCGSLGEIFPSPLSMSGSRACTPLYAKRHKQSRQQNKGSN